MSLKYYTSPVSASALFLDQSDLSIPLNSQSQVVRTRMAAVCSTLVADVKCFSLVLLYNNTANLGLLFDREIFNERSKNDLYE